MKKLTYIMSMLAPFLMALAPGDQAPPFAAKNQAGAIVQLSDFKGKFVLLYFYPKDDTPGCTREACSFRDEFSTLKKMNTVVLGVSRQGEKSHQEFRAKHQLPFDLLVDSDGALSKAYGVGSIPILGILKRESVLIGPDGKVVHFYEKVDAAKHAQEVIKDVMDYQNSHKAT